MSTGRWLDDAYGGMPPSQGSGMPTPRFDRYCKYGWPLLLMFGITFTATVSSSAGWLYGMIAWVLLAVPFWAVDARRHANRKPQRQKAGSPKAPRNV